MKPRAGPFVMKVSLAWLVILWAGVLFLSLGLDIADYAQSPTGHPSSLSPLPLIVTAISLTPSRSSISVPILATLPFRILTKVVDRRACCMWSSCRRHVSSSSSFIRRRRRCRRSFWSLAVAVVVVVVFAVVVVVVSGPVLLLPLLWCCRLLSRHSAALVFLFFRLLVVVAVGVLQRTQTFPVRLPLTPLPLPFWILHGHLLYCDVA